MRIGYYRQLSQELNDSLRVIQYIEGIRLSVKTASGETISAAKMLERFLFQGSQQWTYIRDLSGESVGACISWVSSWKSPMSSSWMSPPTTWTSRP